MAKSKISAPVGFFNAKCKPQQSDIQQPQQPQENQPQQNQLVFSIQENKTYTRYIADDGQVMYSLKIQKDGTILRHVVGADGIVKSPKTDSEKAVFCKLVDYMKTVKQQNGQTPTVWQSLGFSLDLIPTGKFITVEFINKRGEVSRYNGRTGVKKYLAGRGAAETIARDNITSDYFILWVRRAGIKFDSVAMIHKRRIVKLSAGGVVLWQNKASHYAKTV